ncbi:hypothetical protein [Rhizobium sp. WW_1]|jgi:hypothetical protein|uniref:hypothetical protein n=1 Tax=Rhizobium sp. WW_1 TaxID=1907375 RepID=UPI0006465584|nr:hypothetical protein [Rhizobium sp. WW_1]RKD69011.1 hypothetical protein BJ928_104149 [Rhizobium sp. WW_1]
MTRCDLRSHHECSCRPGECAVAPMLDLRDTPVIRFSTAQHFIVAALVTAFMAAIGYGALSSANEAYSKQFKIEQESSVHVARR